MIEPRLSHERGYADYEWLKAYYSFSFARYQDPEQKGFSDLLVINDDQIAPSKGFGMHSHQNMEIFTYILDGALEHKDSMGNGSIIHAGDVQLMSAGSGVLHSEFNPSSTQTTHSLQMWIIPNKENIEPNYQQRSFSVDEKRGKLKLIISSDSQDDALHIHQDIQIYAGLFDQGEETIFDIPPNRYVYFHIAKGSVTINDMQFHAGDGARVRHESKLKISQGQHAEILLFDMRPLENNQVNQ